MTRNVYQPLDRILSLSKKQAAVRQVQCAVIAQHSGDYDIAITLAGAAEGMLDGDPDIEITTQFLNSENAIQKVGKKAWIDAANIERNWLKHKTENWNEDIEFSLDNSSFYIYRAIRKLPLELITAEMLAFEKWYLNYIQEQIMARKSE